MDDLLPYFNKMKNATSEEALVLDAKLNGGCASVPIEFC